MWRRTPQTLLVINLLQEKGHATNQELAKLARQIFPNITDTTIHRITARLVNADMASYAPSLTQVKVIDANIEAHDHFLCQACHKLVDIHLSDTEFKHLESQLPGNLARKNILIAGLCAKCDK